MGFSESVIRQKIQVIVDSYYLLTGRGEGYGQTLSLAEYREIRELAINELKEGIYEEEQQKNIPVRPKAKEEKTAQQNSEVLHYDEPKVTQKTSIIPSYIKDDDGFGDDDFNDNASTNALMEQFNKMIDM